MFGFLNVNKPSGMTSHDVVDVLRKSTKIRQIGHTGTLDPFAQGVLPVCIGKATRLIEYLDDEKAYIATVQFGKNTTTYDIDGEETETFDKKITEETLIATLPDFRGEIEQLPPIYSAVRVNGKRLYKYALEGKEVEIEPRKVFIEKLELQSFDEKNQNAKLYVKCSKGTYIRSIGYDIGKTLKCGAYLSALTRVQAGNFLFENSINLEDLKTKEEVEKNLIYPLEKLNLQKVEINDIEYERISHGMKIINKGIDVGQTVVLVKDDKLISIAVAEEESLKSKKVFI